MLRGALAVAFALAAQDAASVGGDPARGEQLYVRCEACGETWTIPERRKTVRQSNRAARFPMPPAE